MQLILTHENSDFDAVASQLAAKKLYPDAVPILSWRINRNVEQYLRLYWEAFDFVRAEDWKRKRVERVILVDTESLPSVRGLRPDRVEVQIIDHHEPSNDRREQWKYHVELVGATTTLLAEKLQAAGTDLTASEATLLLLGIHEDTGSLVYDTTTSRDARATSWLMEQGAQLSVVRRFLNIPLSDSQRELSDRLQAAIQWTRIEGQSIAFAAAEAPPGFDEEISAVAHSLRDALTPDAMFLLVQLKYNHIQLVARSSTDYVDVASIAAAFGGGGHSRAAAATVMDRQMSDLLEQLLSLLPEAITPMLRVAQIMSFGVQTISTDASVGQAAERMQKFGHEGYPVVEGDNGRLVGLLTRRIVDRAMSHGLDQLPVSQVMKVGHVTVQQSDPVDRVQQLMIDAGWGQIPVVSTSSEPGNSDELIGIVTRTDIINLQVAEREGATPDMRHIMSHSLPTAIWKMIQLVGEEAHKKGMPLFFVGGLVRDLILDKTSHDIDMVVEGDAIGLVEELCVLYGGEIRSHAQFGTAKWLLTEKTWQKLAPGDPHRELPMAIDFVTARTEFYTQPSALPEVERGSIKLDLHRRDFTINTLAVRLDGAHLGKLLDFYGGMRDISSRVVRVLHSLSFVDDPTRILRAIRLEQRLDFSIEDRTLELIVSALPMLDRVTGDRIRSELEMCLREPARTQMMRRLSELGVLDTIHPSLTWHPSIEAAFVRADDLVGDPVWQETLGAESPVFVYFALLVVQLEANNQKEIMDRLRVRKTTREDVLAVTDIARETQALHEDAKPSEITHLLSPYPLRSLLAALALVGSSSFAGQSINNYYRNWRFISTSTKGKDLLRMGLEPGPRIGKLLEELLDARLDGEIQSEDGEVEYLAKLGIGEKNSSGQA